MLQRRVDGKPSADPALSGNSSLSSGGNLSNTILLGTSFFANAARPAIYADATGTSHLIIATFTASFTTRHETIA